MGGLCRYQVVGDEHIQQATTEGKGIIIALWHGRMLLPVYHLRNRGITALVSLHMDGELIARIVERLGYLPRRGSPKEGGREGFMAMLRDLKEGRTVAIFPDGPTGPRHSVRDGVLHLARLSGAPIVPISFSANPAWKARSWDQFTVMKPFSTGVITIGEPFIVPRKLTQEDLETEREIIKSALTKVEQQADDLMGFTEEIKR